LSVSPVMVTAAVRDRLSSGRRRRQVWSAVAVAGQSGRRRTFAARALVFLLLAVAIASSSSAGEAGAGQQALDGSSAPAQQACARWQRPLNPTAAPPLGGGSPEPALDRHFRLAFERETAGDFRAAIEHYRRAAALARCDCERAHAQAGVTAAEEAAALLEEAGMAARPTQRFWARLQQLTEGLACVRVQ
jgi:hypothetical protein